MAAVAHSPEFSKRTGVSMDVGAEFMEADKGKKFRTGRASPKAGINKQKTNHGAMQMPNAMLNKYSGHKDGGIMKAVDSKKNPGLAKLPTEVRNKMGYMKKGGMAHEDMAKDMPMMEKVAKKAVKGHEKKMHGMAKGGVTRADGCVSKGHTKGTMVKMSMGGKC